jgi:hypothetical protein
MTGADGDVATVADEEIAVAAGAGAAGEGDWQKAPETPAARTAAMMISLLGFVIEGEILEVTGFP